MTGKMSIAQIENGLSSPKADENANTETIQNKIQNITLFIYLF